MIFFKFIIVLALLAIFFEGKKHKVKREVRDYFRALKLQPDFDYIVKNIEGSDTLEQMESCFKMIRLFDRKHRYLKFSKKLEKIYFNKIMNYE